MKNKTLLLCFSLIFLSGCGFSSGLYKDILKAQDLIHQQNFEKAVQVYEGILLKKPSKNIQIKINDQLGDVYSIYLNDYTNSLRHYNSIIEDSNEPLWQVQTLEKIGKIYFESLKDYNKSKDVYLKLVNFIPVLKKQIYYKFRYAHSLFQLSQYTVAIEVFNQILKSDDNVSALKSYYYLGLAYFYKKQWVKANEFWFEYLKRETRKDLIVKTKFLIANSYESSEKLKKAYNIYYSILGEYPNPEVIKNRLNSLYERRIARKR